MCYLLLSLFLFSLVGQLLGDCLLVVVGQQKNHLFMGNLSFEETTR